MNNNETSKELRTVNGGAGKGALQARPRQG